MVEKGFRASLSGHSVDCLLWARVIVIVDRFLVYVGFINECVSKCYKCCLQICCRLIFYIPNVVLPLPIWQENTHWVDAGSFFRDSTSISKQLSSGALSSTTGTITHWNKMMRINKEALLFVESYHCVHTFFLFWYIFHNNLLHDLHVQIQISYSLVSHQASKGIQPIYIYNRYKHQLQLSKYSLEIHKYTFFILNFTLTVSSISSLSIGFSVKAASLWTFNVPSTAERSFKILTKCFERTTKSSVGDTQSSSRFSCKL